MPQLAPRFHVYRPTGLAHNFAFFNPKMQGVLQGGAYFAGGAPEGVGFGGQAARHRAYVAERCAERLPLVWQAARMRLLLDDDLNALTWHPSCTTHAPPPKPAARSMPLPPLHAVTVS